MTKQKSTTADQKKTPPKPIDTLLLLLQHRTSVVDLGSPGTSMSIVPFVCLIEAASSSFDAEQSVLVTKQDGNSVQVG